MQCLFALGNKSSDEESWHKCITPPLGIAKKKKTRKDIKYYCSSLCKLFGTALLVQIIIPKRSGWQRKRKLKKDEKKRQKEERMKLPAIGVFINYAEILWARQFIK